MYFTLTARNRDENVVSELGRRCRSVENRGGIISAYCSGNDYGSVSGICPYMFFWNDKS
jgi:hypothetical protein